MCVCIRGSFLCPTAQQLWAKVGMAYATGDYAEYRAAWDAYSEHMEGK